MNIITPEKRYFEQLLRETFERVAAEYKFKGSRRYKFDYYLSQFRVAIEIEGGIYLKKSGHNTSSGILRDIEKYNLALLEDIVVYRIAHHEILTPAIVLHISNIKYLVELRKKYVNNC